MSFSLKQKHYAILNFAGVRVNPYDRSDQYQNSLRETLRKGLYFFGNTLKYWVNSRGDDCFALYARTLNITGSDDPSCWKWDKEQEDEVGIEVAESVSLRWLEVQVRFSSVNLQQNTTYKVSFTVKATNWQMLNFPLTVRLILPNGTKIENPVSITGSINNWQDLPVGTFQTSNNNVGVLDVALLQVDPSWKRGIAIKCVNFVPQN